MQKSAVHAMILSCRGDEAAVITLLDAAGKCVVSCSSSRVASPSPATNTVMSPFYAHNAPTRTQGCECCLTLQLSVGRAMCLRRVMAGSARVGASPSGELLVAVHGMRNTLTPPRPQASLPACAPIFECWRVLEVTLLTPAVAGGLKKMNDSQTRSFAR